MLYYDETVVAGVGRQSKTPAKEVMSKLLRYHKNHDICFITSVTNNREEILVDHSSLLIDAMNKFAAELGYKLLAYAIMPDHFHALIDCNGNDLSLIIRKIKLSFSKNYRNRTGYDSRKIWQNRFWDHIIRNQQDLKRHFDYIHWNPVKHKYVADPFKWHHTSIHQYEDYYADGLTGESTLNDNNVFGE